MYMLTDVGLHAPMPLKLQERYSKIGHAAREMATKPRFIL